MAYACKDHANNDKVYDSKRALLNALTTGYEASGMTSAAAKKAAGQVKLKQCSCGLWFD